MERFAWNGKAVVVTGGASGIGLTIASTFHALGARVAICGRDREALDRAAAEMPGIFAQPCDISRTGEIAAFFDAAVSHLGRLDFLVNNAAVPGVQSELENLSDDDWDSVVSINLSGLFRTTRAAIPHLKAAGGGAIINIGSTAGTMAFPRRSAYSATKWAVVGLTKTLARELGPHHIRVNVVAPGVTDGERIRKYWDMKARADGVPVAEVAARVLSASSLGTLISPQEVADMVAYLCGPGGRAITGQVVSICGGTEWIA